MRGTQSTATVSGHNQDATEEQQWATTAVHVANRTAGLILMHDLLVAADAYCSINWPFL